MNVVIIQARLSSTRFPEKIIQPIWKGLSAIDILIRKLESCKAVDKIVVATTENPKDDKLVHYLVRRYPRTYIFRGSEDDVFDRMTQAAKFAQKNHPEIDTIIELTSDCPFADMELLTDMLFFYNKYKFNYLSNIITRGFPIGYDIQIYRPECLDFLNSKIANKNHKTHGGWNIVNYSILFTTCIPSEFRMGNCYATEHQFHPTWRIVLDYPEDLILLQHIITHFDRLDFGIDDVVNLMNEQPALLEINKNCTQNIAGTDKVKEK